MARWAREAVRQRYERCREYGVDQERSRALDDVFQSYVANDERERDCHENGDAERSVLVEGDHDRADDCP